MLLLLYNMIFIEFPVNLTYGLNLIKYRDVSDDKWYYMYMDIETLNLLFLNFGIISTRKIYGKKICCDNPSTGPIIQIKYCGADVELHCKNKSRYARYFYLPDIEQNY